MDVMKNGRFPVTVALQILFIYLETHMHHKRIIALFLLLSLAWLTACAGELLNEPTPIPPPPAAGSDEANTDSNPPVATPLATDLPEETAVDPTPTLVPTETPTPEIVVTAVTDPHVQVINSQPLPATSRDLLFIADGSFKQWNHATGQIETIVAGTNGANLAPESQEIIAAGSIASYVMSADGKRAVVARVLNAANAPDVQNAPIEYSYELLFVDMISGEVWTLVPQVDNLLGYDLSPNAQQLAFIGSGLNGIPDATSVDLPATNLYILETGGGNPANLRQVHSCQTYCRNPKWHIENNLVAFGDDEALWLYNIAADEPEMLFENTPFEREMSDVGQVSVYWPQAWASNGRYLMLLHGRWEGASNAILDIPTGSLIEVPNSFIYAEVFPPQVSWMPDDRVLVWQTEENDNNFTPLVELWRFDLGSGKLVLEESAQLSDEMMGVMGGTYLEDGRFAFALDAPPTPNTPTAVRDQIGTYQLTSLAEAPERVNSLPVLAEGFAQMQALWAKDGSGAFLTQTSYPNQPKLFYAPTDGEFLYEVTAVFGQNPHNFQWQPEIIVP